MEENNNLNNESELNEFEKNNPLEKIDELLVHKYEEQVAVLSSEEPADEDALKIFAELIDYKDGVIDERLAIKGLDKFGEKTKLAKQEFGKYPIIDLLLEVVENAITLQIIVIEKIKEI